jgi:integrase
MSTLTFYLRASSLGSKVPGRLYLRLVHRRKSKSLSTPYRLYPDEWDALLQEVITGGDDSRSGALEEASGYILRTRERFNQLAGEFSSRAFYTVNEIFEFLCPPRYSKDSLVEYAHRISKQLASPGRERTARAYTSAVKKLLGFTRTQDIRFRDITPALVQAYEESLKKSGKSLNTISFYMRNLRSLCYKAQDEGLVLYRVNPFKGVFTGFHKTTKRALDTGQMQRLQQLPYSRLLEQCKEPLDQAGQKLYTAWRYFIFCFHARGMCFVDMAYLRKDNIRAGVIHYYRKKTGGLIEVKITPVMQSILDSFSNDVINSPYLFPVITDTGKKERLQYETGLRLQNLRLKELARRAGITSPLTTHVSRHSWASIAKGENLPLWVISEGLGHNSEKTTYTYLAQLERSRLDIANELICAAISGRASPNRMQL